MSSVSSEPKQVCVYCTKWFVHLKDHVIKTHSTKVPVYSPGYIASLSPAAFAALKAHDDDGVAARVTRDLTTMASWDAKEAALAASEADLKAVISTCGSNLKAVIDATRRRYRRRVTFTTADLVSAVIDATGDAGLIAAKSAYDDARRLAYSTWDAVDRAAWSAYHHARAVSREVYEAAIAAGDGCDDPKEVSE